MICLSSCGQLMKTCAISPRDLGRISGDMMRVGAIIALGAALSGCTGLNYVVTNYGNVHTQYFTTSYCALYRIFDKPWGARMLIMPSSQKSAINDVEKATTLE